MPVGATGRSTIEVRERDNLERVQIFKSPNVDRAMMKQGRSLFDGKEPIFKGWSLSVLVAVQWAHLRGAKTLLIAGCDLHSNRGLYGYQGSRKDLSAHNLSLNCAYNGLQSWWVHAKRAGLTWLSWSPGSRLEEFLDSYA
jgi:hypothetical protein